jgi:predicted acyltransferase (DUF342 family)
VGQNGEVLNVIEIALLVGAFSALIALPFLPGVVEVVRPRDSAALQVVQENTKEPRHFGMSLRASLKPHLTQIHEVPAFLEIKLRRNERLEVHDEFRLQRNTRFSPLLIAREHLEVGSDASLREAYCMGDAVVQDGVHLRGLAVDGTLTLGENCKVDRWVDAEGAVEVAENCNLGVSVSSGRSLKASGGCTFQRLWGMPVVATTTSFPPEPPTAFDGASASDSLVWGRNVLSLPPRSIMNSPLVIHGDLFVGAGSVIEGDVKAHGQIVLDEGVRVRGNVIARKSLTVGTNCIVEGNLFAEGDIVLGPRSVVGRSGAFKTVYASRRIRLFDEVHVFGWIVAEASGLVG